MFPSPQPLRKVRPSKPAAPTVAISNDLAPPIRPADRIDADIACAILTFLPSSHNLEDLHRMPSINLKARRFRPDRRRVVSMPVFSQSPVWTAETSKRNLGSAVPASNRERLGVLFAKQMLPKQNLELKIPGADQVLVSKQTPGTPDERLLHRMLAQPKMLDDRLLADYELQKTSSLAKPTDVALEALDALEVAESLDAVDALEALEALETLEILEALEPQVEAREAIKSVVVLEPLEPIEANRDASLRSRPEITAVTQFDSSYTVDPNSSLISALDSLRILKLNTYEKILRCYMRSSLVSLSSSSTMPSNVSSNALDDVFDCTSSIYPSDDEMYQHDTLFEDVGITKQDSGHSQCAAISGSTFLASPVPQLPLAPRTVSARNSAPITEAKPLPTPINNTRQPFSYTLDLGAEYDKSRFMIPKENRIHVEKRRLPSTQKRLPTVPVNERPTHIRTRFASGPMEKVKRLFSAH